MENVLVPLNLKFSACWTRNKLSLVWTRVTAHLTESLLIPNTADSSKHIKVLKLPVFGRSNRFSIWVWVNDEKWSKHSDDAYKKSQLSSLQFICLLCILRKLLRFKFLFLRPLDWLNRQKTSFNFTLTEIQSTTK